MKQTRFEKARLVGARALQISMGAPHLLRLGNEPDPLPLADLEHEKGILPITVLRS